MKITVPITVVIITLATFSACASTLTVIPIPSWLPGTNVNEGRAITPDGEYVVGVSGTSSRSGYLYNVANNLVIQPTNSSGEVPSVATGVAYRTDPTSGQKQLVIDGLSGGVQANWMTADGGTNWGATRRDASFTDNTIGTYNTLRAAVGSDIFYQIIRNSTSKSLYTNQGSNKWDSVTSPSFRRDAMLFTTDTGVMNGVAATGRAVGQMKINASGAKLNYIIEYPPGAAPAFRFNGLAGSEEGEAFSVSADGNTVFGRSPTNAGAAELFSYKVVNPGPSQTIDILPEYPDTIPGGGVARSVPYGCTADGDFAVGMNFRSDVNDEKAVLWNTIGANSANWTVVDLTDLATAEGILGNFTRLVRGYSVGKNADGHPVVAGFGFYAGGIRRAFVMVVSPTAASQPRITSISGAGTSSVTVNYTNTLPGTNYTLSYSTNLATPDWYTSGTKQASGTSDFQIDSPPAASPGRYYRVYYHLP